MKRECNIAIIGGGIIGCSLARALSERLGGVVLVEKESNVGLHTSGRNSGVVHSGFNPRPGTLKARLCVEGSKKIRQYCNEYRIPYEQVGTLVVAVTEAEIPILYELKSRGEKNGVGGIEILPMDRAFELEPNVKGLAALFSPTGAIVDSQSLTQTLARDAEQRGATLALNQEVIHIQERTDCIQVGTQSDIYAAQLAINCAGLHADRMAHMMGLGQGYVIAPFRGEYFLVSRPGPAIIRSMVYPVPNPLVPFLGVHLTKTVGGSVLIGPNAVPAFGREAYKRTSFNIGDLFEMARHRGMWNALMRNRALIKVATKELRHSCSRRYFLKEASKLVRGLRLQDLKLGSRVGIRPQLIRSDGSLVEDLVLETTPRSIHVLNVVSPGMTSALAFARWLVDGIDDNLHWRATVSEAMV